VTTARTACSGRIGPFEPSTTTSWTKSLRNHAVFSSAARSAAITIRDIAPDLRRESFSPMDPSRATPRSARRAMFTPTHRDHSRSTFRNRSADASTTTCQRSDRWVDHARSSSHADAAVSVDFPGQTAAS